MSTKEKDRIRVTFDEIKVKSNQLVDKVKEVIEEGNARRVSIRKEGRTLLEFPLSVGVGGATAAVFLMPMLAAVGALAALVSDVHIVVEREEHLDADGKAKVDVDVDIDTK